MLIATPVTAAEQHVSNSSEMGRPTQFGDWIVGCDNTLACDLVSSDSRQTSAFRIHRKGFAAAPPTIEFTSSELSFGSKSLAISIDGGAPLQIETTSSLAEGLSTRALSDPRRGDALLASLRPARSLDIDGLGPRSVTFSLKGLAAALRWIDEQQKRVGTSSALVARGPGRDVITAPIPAPTIGPPAAITTVGSKEVARLAAITLARRPPDPDMSADCYGTNADGAIDPSKAIAYKLTASLAVLLLACDGGAYNTTYSLYVIDPKTGEPANFPINIETLDTSPADDTKSVPQILKPSIDLASATLTQNFKDRAQGDCGWSKTWLWDGRHFVLAGSSAMPVCRGLIFPEWITTYRTSVRQNPVIKPSDDNER